MHAADALFSKRQLSFLFIAEVARRSERLVSFQLDDFRLLELADFAVIIVQLLAQDFDGVLTKRWRWIL